jgi:hypothetical protein
VKAVKKGALLDKIMKLPVVNFNFEDCDTQTGFLAHDLALAAPWAVTGYKGEVDFENRPIYQKADYKGFIPILTAAIQELVIQNKDLVNRLEKFENIICSHNI